MCSWANDFSKNFFCFTMCSPGENEHLMIDQACDLFGDFYAFLVRLGVQRKRRPPSTLHLTRSACSRAGGGIRCGEPWRDYGQTPWIQRIPLPTERGSGCYSILLETGRFKQHTFVSYSSGGQQLEIRGAYLVWFWWGPSSGLQIANFSCVLTQWKERESALWGLFYKGTGLIQERSTLMSLLLPQSSTSPKLTHYGVRIATYGC